jgi:glycosyltransferase involved in cell wall biosynthesis
MRVLINTLCTVGNKAGVGHYASQLVRCLLRQAPDEVFTYPSGLSGAVIRGWTSQYLAYEARRARPGLLARGEAFVRRSALAAALRAGRRLSRDPFRSAVRRGDIELYHEPNFIPLPCEVPTAASVHDLSVLLHPEWHPPARVAEFGRLFHEGLSRCVRLFAISEAGKGEIVRHLGWPAEKVTVTPMGVRPGLRRVAGEQLERGLRELELSEGYLLHVGTLEPRKNARMLIRVYCSLPADLRERCPLVLAGGKGWNSADVHDYLQGEGRHRNVRWLGYVEERLFPSLYSGARALLFPTFYEGFGMPAVEMMACGGAVIASTAEALAEVAHGSAAHLIDARDEDGWRAAMVRACTDEAWLESVSRGSVEHAGRFTWERCAELTLAAYRTTLGRRTPGVSARQGASTSGGVEEQAENS